jgi:two-component system cell cycle response regulator
MKKPFDLQELQVRMRTGRRIVELQAALIDAREQLRKEAEHDALTGLYNRRAMLAIMQRDWSRAQRQSTPLSVLMVDIDHFKKVNDSLGHPAGDTVLCAVATCLTQMLRPYDAVARLGGEEFLLLLPDCDAAGAAVVAERLRAAVAAQAIVTAAGSVAVTCSVGGAVFISQAAAGSEPTPTGAPGAATLTPEALIGQADAALYRAKHGGRNRVVFSHD